MVQPPSRQSHRHHIGCYRHLSTFKSFTLHAVAYGCFRVQEGKLQASLAHQVKCIGAPSQIQGTCWDGFAKTQCCAVVMSHLNFWQNTLKHICPATGKYKCTCRSSPGWWLSSCFKATFIGSLACMSGHLLWTCLPQQHFTSGGQSASAMNLLLLMPWLDPEVDWPKSGSCALQAFYLPFAFATIDLVAGGNWISSLMGILAGHL